MKYTFDYWQDIEEIIHNIPSISKIYNKSIIITGCTGMICSAIADVIFYLNQSYKANIKVFLAGRDVRRIESRFSGFVLDRDYCYVYYNATEMANMKVNADYVIHGASNAHPGIYTKEPVETMLDNIIGLNALLNMCASGKGKRLLYISSSEVYGRKEDKKPYLESDYGYLDILNPRACYPSAKRAAETLCVSYHEEYKVDTVIVRPGHIYGPTITETDTRASAQFSRKAVQKKNIIMKSAGAQLRSYCYVFDCASAIFTVLLNGASGNAYNISNPDSVVTIRDMAYALAKAGNCNVIFENASDEEISGYNLMSNSSLDSEKLEMLGWKASFNLIRGTRRTVKILRQNKGIS